MVEHVQRMHDKSFRCCLCVLQVFACTMVEMAASHPFTKDCSYPMRNNYNVIVQCVVAKYTKHVHSMACTCYVCVLQVFARTMVETATANHVAAPDCWYQRAIAYNVVAPCVIAEPVKYTCSMARECYLCAASVCTQHGRDGGSKPYIKG